MVSERHALESWCESNWGQTPLDVSEWAAHDDVLQVFIKLSRGVLIADFAMDVDGDLMCEEHLHIPHDRWNPGSIQATRISDGRVRFRHRNSDILLAAKMRAPEWGKNVLEDWLMSLRGEQLRPKDKNQRVASIKRIKEIVNRNLHSASLEGIKDDLHLINLRINSAEIGLNPFESTLQEAE